MLTSNDSLCASMPETERYQGINFYLAQAVGVMTIITTFCSTPVAVYFITKRTIFEYSTKVLIFQMLFYAVFFQMTYVHEVVSLLHRSFFKQDKPCELLATEAQCQLKFNFFIFSTSGMIYGLTGLMLERAFGTFFESTSKKTKLTVSLILCAIIGITSLATPSFMLWDDPLDNLAFACYVIPKESIMRASKFYGFSTFLVFVDKVVMNVIKKYNKRFEYRNRFNVSARFHNRQAIESTIVICFMARILLVMILIYTFGIGILLNIKKNIPIAVFGVLISWVYTIPFVSSMIPPILIWRILKARIERSDTIAVITETKQTVDVYFKQVKESWQ